MRPGPLLCPAQGRNLAGQLGLALVDVMMGLVLFGLAILAIYRVFIPTFVLSSHADAQLSAQQDIRLAVDRVARQLHETTLAFGRARSYTAASGCADAYQGCIGFVTARGPGCAGSFHLRSGAPDWQATIYIWRDTASNELRTRCDEGTTFPATQWPPPALTPYAVGGTHVVAAQFTLRSAEGDRRASVAISLQEQIPAGPHRPPVSLFNQTVFVPQNR